MPPSPLWGYQPDDEPQGSPLWGAVTAKYGGHLSDNVSHGAPLSGLDFLQAMHGIAPPSRAGMMGSWANDRSPLTLNRGPYNAMDWVESRFPQANYAQPEEATSSLTVRDQMRMQPFLDEVGSLLDRRPNASPVFAPQGASLYDGR